MADSSHDKSLAVWPAAERNKEPILERLVDLLGSREGLLLEVAAGTGQHAVHFASALPRWIYQPTDLDPEHLNTMEARVRESGLTNLRPPLRLDTTKSPWPVDRCDTIYCANMVHIAPWIAAEGLIAGAGRILEPEGFLLTYGPYRLEDRPTAASNERFDASLRQRNSSWGVRDVADLADLAQKANLWLEEKIAMPANNFLLVWRKQSRPT